MTTIPTSEVLNRAADLIEERGWVAGIAGFRPERGEGACVEGALLAALGLRYDETDLEAFFACPAYQAVARYLDRVPNYEVPGGSHTLWFWNDHIAKSGAVVVETLRACAAIEATRETDAELDAPVPFRLTAKAATS